MVLCLLCLNTIEDELVSIRTNSPQWEELGVALKIEKYFWSLITVQPYSWVCLTCWRRVEEFHKFYLCVEEAHMNFCKIKVEECKDEPTQMSNVEKNVAELDKDDMAYCFLEPEILISKTQVYDERKPDSDKITESRTETYMDGKSQFNENVKLQCFQESEDPLEKSKISSVEKPKKKKHMDRKYLLDEKSVDEKKTKSVNIKREPNDIKANESDSLSNNAYDINDSNYMPDKNNSQNCKRRSNTGGKYRVNREENDKFIAEHFKEMHCNICQDPLADFRAMQKHFLDVHRERGYIVCCNRKYYNRRNLVDHIHCHLNPNHFKCTRCDKVLSDRLRLDKHNARVHGTDVVKKHSCDICGKSFVEIRCLRLHKFTHLSEEEKKFPCKECGKFYGSSDLLHRHMEAVHLKKFVKICYICGKSFGSSTNLKIHMNKHEGIPQPIINCDVCGLRLTTERGLKRHKDSQHPADGKKEHFCPICPKVSPTIKALRKHISTMHEKGYDHKCAICQKAFKRAEVLREHMASHTGTPLYTCPWCPRTFNSNGNMHAHRKKMHPKEWEEAKRQKYSGNLKLM